MTLGAFVDLGVPLDWLRSKLAELLTNEFDISVEQKSRHGISAKHIQVHVKDDAGHRHYSDIVSLIHESPLEDTVKWRSVDIFDRIADAESGIHGCPKEKVHFHEVGGIDAIVDIVGASLCVDYLGINQIIASKIPLGKGFVSCQHGRLPIPAPATMEILKGIPVYGADVPHELVTPTGAAIISTLAQEFRALPDMIVDNIGYGAGTKELDDRPNLLRVMTGKPATGLSELSQEQLILIETCIDDMNPELYGFLMERLFEDGALDVYWIPIFMKKNRPGTMVQVLSTKDRKPHIVQRLLEETTSIGVRHYNVSRNILSREKVEVPTSFGTIQAKKIISPNGDTRIAPEYESCKRVALEKNMPLRSVYETLLLELGQVSSHI
jgi:uncharacterized protein (TIGR00299 family) protein